ncbi:glycosyltransferase family 4 protein [Chloroflexus sp.]|uniref:glycosyltransferase family 4 protein n=2 Tax=Chloroflexus TaxID=1107 RepID=UPI002FD994D5
MNMRIRIVQLIPGLIVGDLGGGLELYSIRLAQTLDPQLFHITIANLWRFDRPIEQYWEAELRASGIEVVYGAPFAQHMVHSVIKAWRGLHPQVQHLHPHIIHAHGEYAGLVGLALAAGRTPFIRTCHTTLEFPRHLQIRKIANLLYPALATVQVGVSDAVVAHLSRHPLARILHRPIYRIHNGIDLRRVLNQRTGKNLRQELGLAPDTILFGLVGRLTEQKGIPDALEAFALARKRIPNAILLIVGSGYGNKPKTFIERAEQLRISQYVFWLGARPDAIDIIANLDVLVSPSLWEGLPTVILEAMAVGTPVVATDIPGTRELLQHEQTGLLVPPRKPEALAQAMEKLAFDKTLAHGLATAAREQVKHFTIEPAARQYEHLYLQVLRANTR